MPTKEEKALARLLSAVENALDTGVGVRCIYDTLVDAFENAGYMHAAASARATRDAIE